ncbi:MAG: SPOR domain-containing protein [Rhodoferax sp.]
MRQQRGGTFLGFVLGIVAGLGAALAVAVYVTKVPVPFVSKAVSRDPAQDVIEQQKNKGWDPNAPLHGKNPAKPAGPAEQVEKPEPAVVVAPVVTPTEPAGAAPVVASVSKPELKPAVTADPLGDLVKARAAQAKGVASAPDAEADPFTYFVQVGAFRTPEDAESQRAKLSLAGIETKVSEREQSGRTVHRVRLGPFDSREAAEKAKVKLDASGIETALVRVQR